MSPDPTPLIGTRVRVVTPLEAYRMDTVGDVLVTLHPGDEFTIEEISPSDCSVGIFSSIVCLQDGGGRHYEVDYEDGWIFGGVDYGCEPGEPDVPIAPKMWVVE